jgi:hypothetical protein
MLTAEPMPQRHISGILRSRAAAMTEATVPSPRVRPTGAWLFAERRLFVDWLEERALS